MKYLVLLPGIILVSISLFAQETFNPPSSPPEIRVTRTNDKILIDGLLQEDAWKSAETITDFVQYEPRQGEKPSFQTAFRILYDDKNIYFSAVCSMGISAAFVFVCCVE